MGARLRWAKVVDREHFYIKGGKVHPGLDSEVVVNDEPGTAATFMVLRAWSDGHGTFTEQWRIESPGGTNLYRARLENSTSPARTTSNDSKTKSPT